MRYMDYHTHSLYSFDGECELRPMLAAAVQRGIQEVCFTDHLDFDMPEHHIPDFNARRQELSDISRDFPQLTILQGAEVSLRDEVCARQALEAIKDQSLDYILGSIHTIEGEDVWRDCFYEGKSKETTYCDYLETVRRVLPSFPAFHALGHYDFVAKYAPYTDRAVTYTLCPEVLDDIFRYLIENGKTLEINTASWQQSVPWGLDILKRFRTLGGEFVTVGSDTHGAERMGARIEEALALAKTAGIPYLAAYRQGKPVLHKLSD